MTVKELYNACCKAIMEGHGDSVVFDAEEFEISYLLVDKDVYLMR